MPRHVRQGDTVVITSGDARGKRGTVLRVLADDRVLVQGVNVCKRHTKPNQKSPQGGIIEKEMPIHISNVSPLADDKPTRVRFKVEADGSKHRIAATNGQKLGSPLKKASR